MKHPLASPWLLLLLTFSLGCEPGGGDPPTEDFVLGGVPEGLSDAEDYFSKYISVFGVHVLATSDVSDAKIQHAAGVMAQYLDNDADGAADDPPVLAAMLDANATLTLFGDEDDPDDSDFFDSEMVDTYNVQDLFAEETLPGGSNDEAGFDASLEEVLHLICDYGYADAYPDRFGTDSSPGSSLTAAMDLARGGHFADIPDPYPSEAWYHYDDDSCDYSCQATEYMYWATTTLLGAQDYGERCEEIFEEWELCSPADVESRDPAVFQLLTAPEFTIRTLPDGNYGGN